MVRICSLMTHTDRHSTQELLINLELFKELMDGDYIYVFDIERPHRKFVLRVMQGTGPPVGARLEISILNSVAENLNVKPFSKVGVEKVSKKDAEVDFVELSFRKQFLQRGNLWRFKNSVPVGQPIHVGGYFSVDGIQAQIQEIGKSGSEIATISGVITENTHFNFRSRSTRIIWLVQISKEMYEFDQNNDLYFEKFLLKFVDPLLDQWKSLGVSHLLSVIFFARTLYPERSSASGRGSRGFVEKIAVRQGSSSRPAMPPKPLDGHHQGMSRVQHYQQQKTKEGIRYKDYFKTVIDCITDYDKKAIIRTLKEEFWDFPRKIGWSISKASSFDSQCAIPSDASGGNFLEAINSTLNFLDKHSIDRDLQRTGNSIVMISAGTGIFRVRPALQQITKQRMMDNGIGMDFISLSQPPLHTVPLFLVECNHEIGLKDFYEVPHWMNITFVDCDVDPSASIEKSRATLHADDPMERRKNARWTGLESILAADEERGGRLILQDGFLQHIPAEKNSVKYTSRDIWRDVGEFQPLPFASIISGFIQAESASEGHLRSLPTVLQTLLRATKDDSQTCPSDFSSSLKCWGSLDFGSSKNCLSSVFQLGVNDKSESRATVWNLPDLPLAGSLTGSFGGTDWSKGSEDKLAPDTMGGKNMRDRVSSSFDDVPKIVTADAHEIMSHVASDASRTHCKEVDAFMRNISEGGAAARTRESFAAFDAKASTFAVACREKPALPAQNTSSPGRGIDERAPRKKNLGAPLRNTSRDSLGLSLDESDAGTCVPKGTTFVAPRNARSSLNVEANTPPARDSGYSLTSLSQTLNGSGGSITMPNRSPSDSSGFQYAAGKGQYRGTRYTSSAALNTIISNEAYANDIEYQQREFIRMYRKKYSINPFRRGEGKAFLDTRTHNRRRWSHVFPAYSVGRQDNANSYFGLNKKSLTQPAILPLTTDYIPPAKDLHKHFEIQGDYKTTIYNSDCPYTSPEELLKEMVAQRLSMEYQLVEDVDPREYVASSGNGTNKQLIHILSMGHRIHILAYDSSGSGEINVTRYLSKRATNSRENTYEMYSFEMWVPQQQIFQTVNQRFCQYPEPEYAWNRVDEILLGNEDLDTDSPKYVYQDFTDSLASKELAPAIKSRKLGYTILPPAHLEIGEETTNYAAKVELLLQYLQKSSTTDRRVKVVFEASPAHNALQTPSTACLSSTLPPSKAAPIVCTLYLKPKRGENPKWIYLRLDSVFDIYKAYHIQLHWLVCDSWLIEDWLAVLFRRCSGWGLRIIQTPEFFRTPNLQIHPFRSLPRINIPFAETRPCAYSVLVVERLFIREASCMWVDDGECETHWKSLGMPFPSYEDEDNASHLPSSKVESALSSTLSFLRMSSQSTRGDDRSRTGTRADRQYIHRNGYAAVRLGPHGLIWLPNGSPRSNDTIAAMEEKKEAANATFRELEKVCFAAGIVVSILYDLIHELPLVDAAHFIVAVK